jgi:hypothetical protein
MNTDTQQRLIGALASIALVALGVSAYIYGAHELGALIVGGALGHAVPARAQRTGDSLRPPANTRGGFAKPEVLAVALFVLVVALAAWLASGCGASTAVRMAYSQEVARCIANERAIVDREGTTREQDYDDLDAERARCDAALEAIEGGE